jgi:DNA-binding response OmpR family regulator
MEKILVVEDDRAVQKALKRLFSSSGYGVEIAQNGPAGLESVGVAMPSAVVLDLRLPGMQGQDVCRELKNRIPSLPVVVLSASTDVVDKVLLLEIGADDYVTKPFKVRELVARANAFLRRRRSGQETVSRFGDFELNLASHKLFRAGREVELTAKEFRLLAYFASRPGRALSRTDILNAVWGNSVIVTTRSVDRCVTTLRSKIEPDPHNPTYVQTIRDIGYRFEE